MLRVFCGVLTVLLLISHGSGQYYKGKFEEKDTVDGWEDEAKWWRERYLEAVDSP